MTKLWFLEGQVAYLASKYRLHSSIEGEKKSKVLGVACRGVRSTSGCPSYGWLLQKKSRANPRVLESRIWCIQGGKVQDWCPSLGQYFDQPKEKFWEGRSVLLQALSTVTWERISGLLERKKKGCPGKEGGQGNNLSSASLLLREFSQW